MPYYRYKRWLVDEENSCQLNAVNMYFNRQVFNSMDDFWEKQNHNIERAKIPKLGKAKDLIISCMTDTVEVGGFIYTKVVLINNNLRQNKSLSFFLNTLKQLVDHNYVFKYYIDKKLGHDVLFRKTKGKIQVVDSDGKTGNKIPQTNIDVNKEADDKNKVEFKQICYWQISVYECDMEELNSEDKEERRKEVRKNFFM